jgi:hypothetical protein
MGFGGFSWKRALGVTRVKSRISRGIGIPLTRSGRQRKIGAAMTSGCGCCLIPALMPLVLLVVVVVLLAVN